MTKRKESNDLQAEQHANELATKQSAGGDLFAQLLNGCALIESDKYEHDGKSYQLFAMSTREMANKPYNMNRKRGGWVSVETTSVLTDEDIDYLWATGTSNHVPVQPDDVIKGSMLFVPMGAFHYKLLQLSEQYAAIPMTELIGFKVPSYEQVDATPLPLMSFLSPVSKYGKDPVCDYVVKVFKQAMTDYLLEGNNTADFMTSERGQFLRFKLFTEPVVCKLTPKKTDYGTVYALSINPVPVNSPLYNTHAIEATVDLARRWLTANEYAMPEDTHNRDREREALSAQSAS